MGPFLTPDGQLIASTLNEAQAAAWCLESLAAQDEQATAAAVLSGRDGMTEAIPSLAALLDDDGLRAQAAAWALGQLQASKTLLDLTVDGSLDERENAFRGLAIFIGKFPETAAAAGLTQDLHLALDRELERAKSGRTGLCEYACRALATLGDPQSKDAIQRVIDNDPLTDRFELQRLRKELDNSGFDAETRSLAESSWDVYFTDEIAEEPEADGASAEEPHNLSPEESAELAAIGTGNNPLEAAETDQADGSDAADEAIDEADEGGEPPMDLETYAVEFEDPESPDLRLVQQVVPMLTQLSEQAIQIPFQTLKAQEFAALMLQVLPQALPPQYFQALLTPDALNALSRFFRWHIAQGNSSDLLDGLNMVREQLREQVRASGMLGGPDFSDPDAPAASEYFHLAICGLTLLSYSFNVKEFPMAIGLRRKVRLDSRRENQKITRNKNSAQKRPERARRDERLKAKLAAQLPAIDDNGLSADVQSWVAAQLGTPASKASAEALKALAA